MNEPMSHLEVLAGIRDLLTGAVTASDLHEAVDLVDVATLQELRRLEETTGRLRNYDRLKAGDEVLIPQHEAQAEMMAKLGMAWLREHAPHRLKAAASGPTVGAKT